MSESEITVSNGIDTAKIMVKQQSLSEKSKFFKYYFTENSQEPITILNVSLEAIVATIYNTNDCKDCKFELHKIICADYFDLPTDISSDLIVSEENYELFIYVCSIIGFTADNIKLIIKFQPENYDLIKLEYLWEQMLKYSYETRLVIGLNRDCIKVITETGIVLKTIEKDNTLQSLIVMQDKIISGNSNNTIRIWDYNTCKKIYVIEEEYDDCDNTDSVNELSITKDNKYLVSGNENGNISIYDLTTYELITTLRHDKYDSFYNMVISDKYIVSSDFNHNINVWNYNKFLYTLIGHQNDIDALAIITKDNKDYIISGSDDHTIKIWHDEKCIHTIENNAAMRSIVMFGNIIISGDRDGIVRTWQFANDDFTEKVYCETLYTDKKHSCDKMVLSQDQTRLFSTGRNDIITVYDMINNILLPDILLTGTKTCMKLMTVPTPLTIKLLALN